MKLILKLYEELKLSRERKNYIYCYWLLQEIILIFITTIQHIKKNI